MKLREIATIKRETQLVFVSHEDGKELFYNPGGPETDEQVLEEVRLRFGSDFDIIQRYTMEKLMTHE